jgi:hypothetical protein
MRIADHSVLASFIMPFGEWTIVVDQERDSIIIKRKHYGTGSGGARRLLLVDGGEIPRVTDNPHYGDSSGSDSHAP